MHFKVNGKQVFASTGGKPFDKAKPVIIFLHGSALDHTFWGLHSRFFAFRKYAVLVPALPGHSHSEGPALTSIEAIGDWLNNITEVLDIDNISVVAHSQGCLNALEFVSRYPHRICTVSFIASGLATPVNPALIDAAENQRTALAAVSQARGNIQLLAEMTGELAAQPTVNILVSPEWVTVRRAMLEALLPFPEARAEVAGRLIAMEGNGGDDRG